MVDNMNCIRKNALEKIYALLLTFLRSFNFLKKIKFFKNDIFQKRKYFITWRTIKCGEKNET